ncbi:MAG: alanine dehydrogenase [Erysipelothrix sp.]|nr:alanine dehydrogenase [Erysipelothrix sp.]
MIIGSLIELKLSEKRVGLIPEHAKMYIEHGHKVIVESGLGLASGYSDNDYIQVGAIVLDEAKDVWQQAEMIIKVKEPMREEYEYMREGQIIFTYFHLAADKDLTLALLEKKVSALAYETIEDVDGDLVLLRPMSEIAGKLAVLEGNKYLETHYGGKGILLSGTSTVKPGHVVILGVGSVGCAALEEASNLGASITALVRTGDDVSRVVNAYPQAEVLVSTEENIIYALKKADLVISGVLEPGAKTDQLIKREYLQHMEQGSVIIDVAIDQGGSTETSRATTHLDPIYEVDGIIHYCVANMAGSVPRTSSKALGDATIAYGLEVANLGLEKACENPGLNKGINTKAGLLTNQAVALAHNIKFK